jgi:WD40 repeat protein
VLRGRDDVLFSASFNADGQQVVSASWDKAVRVWNADGRGAPIVLRGHDDVVWSASFSELLGVTEEMARDHRARCLARVAEARRAATLQPHP